MSPKAHQKLRDGRLITPTMDSMCGGLNLKVGKLYLIAGNGVKIGICNYAKEYSQMTIVERRGFAGGYKKGCPCEVCCSYACAQQQKGRKRPSLSISFIEFA